MTLKHINPENMGKPAGPYTHVVCAGNFIFLSGQAPIDPTSGQIFSGEFREEAILVFENIKKALLSVDASLNNVVKIQTYLGDLCNKKEFDEIYRSYFKLPYPVRTTIGADLGKIKIEIDVVAYKNCE